MDNNLIQHFNGQQDQIQTISHILTNKIPYTYNCENVSCCFSDKYNSYEIGLNLQTDSSINIIASINNLNASLTEALNSLPADKIIFSIITVFVGALTAWFFTYLHWKITQKNEEKIQTVERIISIINELENISIRYWLEDYHLENFLEIETNELKIKSLIKLFAGQINLLKLIEENCNFPEVNHARFSAIDNVKKICMDLYDIITGDDFESTSRKKSKNKAAKIATYCNNAKMKLHEYPYVKN